MRYGFGLVAVVLAACAGKFSAAEDGGRVDEGTDAGGGARTGFCGAHPKALFCEDFDETDGGLGRWSRKNGAKGGLSLSTSGAVSAPFALEARFQENGSDAELFRDVPLAKDVTIVSLDVSSSMVGSANAARLVFLSLSPRPEGVTNQAVALDLYKDCEGCPVLIPHQQFADGGGNYFPEHGGAPVGTTSRHFRIELRAANGYVATKLYDGESLRAEGKISGPRPERVTLVVGPGLSYYFGTTSGAFWIDNVLVEEGP